jgi:hypothetical protein
LRVAQPTTFVIGDEGRQGAVSIFPQGFSSRRRIPAQRITSSFCFILKMRMIAMAKRWGIIIEEKRVKKHGKVTTTITFTPDVARAKEGQPLGASQFDDITWNNRTNQEIKLISIQPPGLFLTEPIPAGKVSNPIFAMTDDTAIGYCWVRPNPAPNQAPDHWIVQPPV